MEDVALIAAKLADVTEGTRHGNRSWSVGGRTFAWERPLTKADVKRFGDQVPPQGPILAVLVEDLGERDAMLAANPKGLFTMVHFADSPAVLLQLPMVSKKALRAALVDGWLCCAPAKLTDQYLRR